MEPDASEYRLHSDQETKSGNDQRRVCHDLTFTVAFAAVASIVRRGVLVRPTGTVPNRGSQLAVQVPVLLWRWLKEAGKMNSAT
jgi:hypothetical protein